MELIFDINVQLVDLKTTAVDELVRHNEDDSYTILLNRRQATNRLRTAYKHALWHIQNNDFDNKDGDIQEIETVAHEMETKRPLPRE